MGFRNKFLSFFFYWLIPICIYYDLFSAWDRREIIIIHLSIFFWYFLCRRRFGRSFSWRFLPYFIDPFLLPFPQSLLSRADTGACRWSSSLLSLRPLYTFSFSLSLWRPTTVVLIFFPRKRENKKKGKKSHAIYIIRVVVVVFVCVFRDFRQQQQHNSYLSMGEEEDEREGHTKQHAIKSFNVVVVV